MHRVHKIKLDPTQEQAIYFARACGVARFAFNWALAAWKEEYEADAYACHLGLGGGLGLRLYHIESIYGTGSAGFFKSLLNDHPDTPKRIERIRKYLETH